MGIIDQIPHASTPGSRVALLAEESAKQYVLTKSLKKDEVEVPTSKLALWHQLCAKMCWDASLYCAWAASGITCDEIQVNSGGTPYSIVNKDNYERIFGNNPKTATTPHQIITMPPGCFVGFVNTVTKELRHCMIHIGNGQGAGTKNDCVLSAGATGVWQKLDIAMFLTKDKEYNGNQNCHIIYQKCTGQKV